MSLTCLPPRQLDSTVCKDMSVSDTEASDVTWTDNGTFNLSEGHTPQTDNSDGTFVTSAASCRRARGLKIETLRNTGGTEELEPV